MSTFDKREDAEESRFAHDEELRFKATARRDRELGLWAADKLGKTGADAESYARSMVATELSEGGDDGIFKRIRADFDTAGVAQSDHQIRREMDELMAKALSDARANG